MVLAKPPCNSRAPIFSLSNAPDRVRRGCTLELLGLHREILVVLVLAVGLVVGSVALRKGSGEGGRGERREGEGEGEGGDEAVHGGSP
jgi:hypothetical protein